MLINVLMKEGRKERTQQKLENVGGREEEGKNQELQRGEKRKKCGERGMGEKKEPAVTAQWGSHEA